MIFSLFRKKKKAATRPSEDHAQPALPDPAPAGNVPAAVSQREIGRLTAAKIDLIESQMDLSAPTRPSSRHAAGLPRHAGPCTLGVARRPIPAGIEEGGLVIFSTAGAGSQVRAGAAPRRLEAAPADDPGTSLVLGDEGAPHAEEAPGSGLLPVFEEASVHYANGKADLAAMILWQTIKENKLGQRADQAWRMLFELYQALGRRPEFQGLSINYASRFGSSPPVWSDELAPPTAMQSNGTAILSSIEFPAALDAHAISHTEQMQQAAERDCPVAADFGQVATVDPVGADLLLQVLFASRKYGRRLTLSGIEQLGAALSASIENGRRDPSSACWLLRLETLRLLGEQQQFDDLAIEYCVTYEVPPPPWEPMPDSIRLRGSAAVESGATSRAGRPDEAFVLEGEIDGRTEPVLKSLRAYSQSRAVVFVDCRRLRRMSVLFAGEMLNEVAAMHSAGKSLVFNGLTQLVACLLMVMGVHDLAQLNLKTY